MASSSMLRTCLLVLGMAGVAHAQPEVIVNTDITTSTTWTPANRYNLTAQVNVKPGASLTIQAGTIVASNQGSLAVEPGGQIFVQGTVRSPVIMTSKADFDTWNAGQPRGAWRESANEWGNLTVMGRAYVSSCGPPPAGPTCSAMNRNAMEGLTANNLYGGGNDDDDSGDIRYLQIRYAGRVVGLNNELNGLSLGGVGRATDIRFVEIMNNVDDGIEIWGGTVNLKYFAIWNVGDDSFDVDQGWRGKAQFGLIVQGFSRDGSQGSGVGDNCFETDGAEESDHQPVTRATIYNCTVIGQPADGDHAMAFRDCAGVQYRNCVFMDIGAEVVRFDNVDGDPCGTGYGFNNALAWDPSWTMPYTVTETVNACANAGARYTAQSAGTINEVSDSVFFDCNNYAEADRLGLTTIPNAHNNEVEPFNSPIMGITRDSAVTRGGLTMRRVTFLDPRPAADALDAAACAPNDGFFSPADYRGAFAPGNNWGLFWTAAHSYGFFSGNWGDLAGCVAGALCCPVLSGSGPMTAGSTTTLAVSDAVPNALGALVISASRLDLFLPFFGGTLIPSPLPGSGLAFTIATNGQGDSSVPFPWPNNLPSGLATYYQALILDPGAPKGWAFTNGLIGVTP